MSAPVLWMDARVRERRQRVLERFLRETAPTIARTARGLVIAAERSRRGFRRGRRIVL